MLVIRQHFGTSLVNDKYMNDNVWMSHHAFHLLYVPLHRIVALLICHDILHPYFERGSSSIPPLHVDINSTFPAIK